MKTDKLTDAELAEGLRLSGNDFLEWIDDYGETALRELAALRAQLAAERAARERLVAEWRKCDHDGTEWEFGYQSGVLDAADQLAALEQLAAPKIEP